MREPILVVIHPNLEICLLANHALFTNIRGIFFKCYFLVFPFFNHLSTSAPSSSPTSTSFYHVYIFCQSLHFPGLSFSFCNIGFLIQVFTDSSRFIKVDFLCFSSYFFYLVFASEVIFQNLYLSILFSYLFFMVVFKR